MNAFKVRLPEATLTRVAQVTCIGVAVLVGGVHLATFPLKFNAQLT